MKLPRKKLIIGQKGEYDLIKKPKSYEITRYGILFARSLLSGLILDIGGGSAKFSEGLNSVVIDISKKSLKIAKNRVLSVIVADMHYLPFNKNIFDSILLIHVLEHSFLPWNVLKQAYEVLKLNGKLIIALPNAASFSQVINLVFHQRVTPAANPPIKNEELKKPIHFHQYTKKSIEELLSKCNFKIEELYGNVISFPSIIKFRLYRIGRFMARITPRFADTIYILARKQSC